MRSESTLSFTERHRRAQILDAATELLSEGGLAAASLSAIAARIGSSKGVVSYHFDGKDDLLRSVVTSVLTTVGAVVWLRGQFRGVDAMLVARTVRAAIDAVGDLLHAQPDLDIAAYADGLLALIENGIAS